MKFKKTKSLGKISIKPCKISAYMIFLKISNGYFTMVEH